MTHSYLDDMCNCYIGLTDDGFGDTRLRGNWVKGGQEMINKTRKTYVFWRQHARTESSVSCKSQERRARREVGGGGGRRGGLSSPLERFLML